MAKKQTQKTIETLTHKEATRKNIPTAEFQSIVQKEEQNSVRVAYERRNRDLDPQLVWRGKDDQDWSDLVVHAPALYIQEKIHPKVLIDDLLRASRSSDEARVPVTADLFADFNGLSDESLTTEFYQHDANWANRMILGDSLQVMASLAEREGLRGKVQCIYIDPPYGIKFNSNFQWSTTSRDVKDGKLDHITRDPEQVKAFRDTWRDGVHSYLTYLRDRLTVCRDLLSDSGSIFMQIGNENCHRVRTLMDEIFGEENFLASIEFTKSSVGLQSSKSVASITDSLLWYSKDAGNGKFRRLLEYKGDEFDSQYAHVLNDDGTFRSLTNQEKAQFPGEIDVERLIQPDNLTKPGPGAKYDVPFRGEVYTSGRRWWGTPEVGMHRMLKAGRVVVSGSTLRYARRYVDSRYGQLSNLWTGFLGQTSPTYVVQTNTAIVQRCILMTTDPGDLVLDPTCGSATSAFVAEMWGRRWITIDTSRVALALARARIMGARYRYYLLSDSRDGQIKEAEITQKAPSEAPTNGNVRQGFVYERVLRITPSTIANNAEIDVIWDKYQQVLEPLCEKLNNLTNQKLQEWQIPRKANEEWSKEVRALHEEWWRTHLARQKEIDASIAAKAEFQYLYDRPYADNSKARVSGPFTVESVSPHRVLAVSENDELIYGEQHTSGQASVYLDRERDFAQMILDHLKTSGVQQAQKKDKITFTSVVGWPGDLICAEGRYIQSGNDKSDIERRAAIFLGPEFGTVSRQDLVLAAREAGDADFDILIACAFNFDALSTEFDKLGRIPVLKAHINADLHMADDLKNTGKGNLFVIFGEPDIEIMEVDNSDEVQVKINGVDVFYPQTGEVRSDGVDGIACWFIDTNYNEESFFVRHAYFLGANDPYQSLKTTLKAEINEEAWDTLNSDLSRPFEKPKSGRIAVKAINHLGDEVMRVFKVE